MTFIPADLSGTTESADKNYFLVTIPDLDLNTAYDIQFAWIYADKTLSDASAKVSITTANEGTPNKPKFASGDLSYDLNALVVKWSGLDYLDNAYGSNLDRIDIFIKGGSFGSSYVRSNSFFKQAGTKTIIAQAGTYYVKLQAVTKNGTVSDFSSELTVTTESPIVVDLTPPDNPTSITASAGIDPNDQSGFSLYADISWSHAANASTNGTRGYRIRWTYDTSNEIYEYAYVDYPNNTYRATGLIPNVTYYYQVASVDQYNNTQTYSTAGTFSANDSVATAEGSFARLKSFLSIGGATGDLFKFGTGIATSVNTSLTTTPSLSSGTYNGIILNKTGNKNNYWLTTGQFRVGGNSQFMYWDGTDLSITGNLGVGGSAKIAGHIQMGNSGSSVYYGTIVSNDLSGAGFILNSDGLKFIGSGGNTITLSSSSGAISTGSSSYKITINETADAINFYSGGLNPGFIATSSVYDLGKMVIASPISSTYNRRSQITLWENGGSPAIQIIGGPSGYGSISLEAETINLTRLYNWPSGKIFGVVVSNLTDENRQLVVNQNGDIYLGPRSYYGTSSTPPAINVAVNGQYPEVGDFYFSTAV